MNTTIPNIDQNIQTITFGTITMNIDSFVFIINGIILFFLLVNKYGYSNIYLRVLFIYIIGAYNINCMILGSCNSYARFYSIMCSILTIYYFISKDY
jgi:Na+-translocating ferredoxin:NAD+ oxidoreductase RnfE subunit